MSVELGSESNINIILVKLGCERVYNFLLFLIPNIDCGYSCTQINVLHKYIKV